MLASGLRAPSQARGEASVWSIKGAHNTVYLAGSVHALPREHAELSPQLERAYAASKVIVMEVDLDDLNPLEAVQFVTSNGTLPADQDLKAVMGADRYATVARLASSLDLPELVIARLEPWAAAMVLTQFALVKSGFDPQLGIDMQLTERAKTDGKRIDGLETVIDQLSIFDSRSFEEQTQVPGRLGQRRAEDAPKISGGWSTPGAAATCGPRKGIRERTRAGAGALRRVVRQAQSQVAAADRGACSTDDQDCLVLVGTLHFVGRDGLLELLTRAGHKPVPLPADAPGPCAVSRSFSG